MALYVGTSGWAYKEWKPGFYPDKLPQNRFLEHYATQFNSCEINATFYGRQKPTTYAKWVNQTPDGFRFAVKAHRLITHTKALTPDEMRRDVIAGFFGDVELLGDRLGPVLMQIPKFRKRDDEGLEALLSALPGHIVVAFEFLDESWNVPDVHEAVGERGHAWCYTHREGPAPEELPQGTMGYARLRAESYADRRDEWVELLAREGRLRDVFVFAKHEGGPPDDTGMGVGFVRWVREQLAGTSVT